MTIKLIQSAISAAGFDCCEGNTDTNDDDLEGQSGYSEEGTGVYVGKCCEVCGGGFVAYYLDVDGVPGNDKGFGESPEDAIADI